MNTTDQDINRNPNPNNNDPDQSRQLLIMSIISSAIYLILALLIHEYIGDEKLANTFHHGYSIQIQLLIGLGAGTATATVIGAVISRPAVSEILNDFYIIEAVSKMSLDSFDRFQISAFAGTGEELLFRGAIQPLLGNGITSLIFISIHGYFKFKSPKHILFGVMMFGLSLLLGYLFEHAGLISAMTTHAVYDMLMLKMVQAKKT